MRFGYPSTFDSTPQRSPRGDRCNARTTGTVRPVRPRAILAVVVATAAITACADDSEGDGGTGAATTAIVETTSDQPEPMSAEVICERLSIDSITSDTGLDITRTVPDDTAAPRCTYEYTNEDGGVSALTVEVMRGGDVDGLTGRDAFDLVVQEDSALAGDDVEMQEVSAGDAAIRISGSSTHVGVVLLGDRVLTVVIPAADVGTDAVDRLITTMATTLG